jgi:hypothetical protein
VVQKRSHRDNFGEIPNNMLAFAAVANPLDVLAAVFRQHDLNEESALP